MTGCKVSLIIPVYNTEKYLRRCLDSAVSQTYKNMEIICIDDGSSDGSEKIVDEFAEKDKRVVAIHQQNMGESGARNVGLRASTGEYIAFMDCDDWIGQNMYEILVETLEKENVDMVAASWYREIDGVSHEIKNELSVNRESFDRDELLKYLYMRDSYRGFAYIWDKLYRKEILRDQRGKLICFNETLKLGGDVLYLAEIALNVKRSKYIEKAFYHYNQREESGCHTKDLKKIRDWIRAYEIILQKFKKEHVDDVIMNYVKRFLAYHSSNAVEIAIAQGQESTKKEFQKFMRLYEDIYVKLNIQYPERIIRYQSLLVQ